MLAAEIKCNSRSLQKRDYKEPRGWGFGDVIQVGTEITVQDGMEVLG